MLALPDDVLLLVSDFLPRSDIQTLLRVCQRLRSCLSSIRFKTLRISEDDTVHSITTLSTDCEKFGRIKRTRSLAFNTKSRYHYPPQALYTLRTAIQRILSYAEDLECLTFIGSYTSALASSGEPLSPRILSQITHLELIDTAISTSFLSSFPALTGLTLGRTKQVYEMIHAKAFVNALTPSSANGLTSFKISLRSAPVDIITHIARSFPSLQVLHLFWSPQEDIPPDTVQVENCAGVLKQYAAALSLCSQLKRIFLPFCFGQGTVRNVATSQEVASGYVFPRRAALWKKISAWPFERKEATEMVRITDVGCASACDLLAKSCPELQVVGWVVPQPYKADFTPMVCVKKAAADDTIRWTCRARVSLDFD